ncbi:MAG TPA: GNAT family protein [Patescibacteria group bacterium]|nr:GNAT family protein [Patescibacteria group bacterium]
MPVVRLFTPDEWPLYKAVRLRALQTDPKVFGSNYAREVPRPDEEWQRALTRADMGVFGIFEGDAVIGMTGIVIDAEDPSTAKLWGSWLAPEWRGRGISADMYRARIGWAEAHPTARRIIVSHRESNLASKHANQKHGFVQTHLKPHLWHDGVSEPEVFYALILRE